MPLRKVPALFLVLTLAATPLAASQAKPVNLTGTWTGTLSPDSGQSGGAHLELKHEGAVVTGTGGPAADRQVSIDNGKFATVDGVTTVTFSMTQPNGSMLQFDLKVIDGRLKGQVVMEMNGQKREGNLDVGRAK